MARTPPPRRSTWERIDGLIAIGVAAIVVLVALRILAALAGLIAWLVQAAIVVLIIVVIARLISRRR